jgi:hypothetical protein
MYTSQAKTCFSAYSREHPSPYKINTFLSINCPSSTYLK